MESMVDTLSFYKGKTVLVTGHTGFKGSWLCKILIMAGAKVIGYSLKPSTKPNLYSLLSLDKELISIIGDIRDYRKLLSVFIKHHPEIIFHLAAQPIVRESYRKPLYTYEVNVLGTVNLLECIRSVNCVRSIVNVTTDKVYENNEQANYSFVEGDKLNGYDPYSNSKSCSELVTYSYNKCFFSPRSIAVSTVRAGNVIGGGDFSQDRIIPDCIKSIMSDSLMLMRNPNSIRPYQHVLEPLHCYLMIGKYQFLDNTYCGAYNIGPNSEDCVTTEILVQYFQSFFPASFKYKVQHDGGPHEASFLRLDNSKIKRVFDWLPKTSIKDAIRLTAEWSKVYISGASVKAVTEQQITEFFNL